MSARTATVVQTAQKAQRELEDLQLVMKARNGSEDALDTLMRRYTGFVRMKASSYFLAGGDSDDLVQEGLIGLYKALRPQLPRVTQPLLVFRSSVDHVADPGSHDIVMREVSSRDLTERILENSYHVATLDNDAPVIFEESAEFVRRVTGP